MMLQRARGTGAWPPPVSQTDSLDLTELSDRAAMIKEDGRCAREARFLAASDLGNVTVASE